MTERLSKQRVDAAESEQLFWDLAVSGVDTALTQFQGLSQTLVGPILHGSSREG